MCVIFKPKVYTITLSMKLVTLHLVIQSLMTIILSLKDSETMPKSAIFKLLELPWDSPTFPVQHPLGGRVNLEHKSEET